MTLMHRIGILATAATLAATCAPVSAGPLTIVETGFPAVNCLFQASCTIVVSDSSSKVDLGFDSGSGFFQSRIWNAAAGTPPRPDICIGSICAARPAMPSAWSA